MQVQGKYDARAFLAEQMTRAQGLKLKRLSEEAYQPAQYERALSSSEAARRIQVLEAEIDLANSF
jgi:predicted Zn-dependent protease